MQTGTLFIAHSDVRSNLGEWWPKHNLVDKPVQSNTRKHSENANASANAKHFSNSP